MSFDWIEFYNVYAGSESQSLWNRAGSFDSLATGVASSVDSVSIPLEQGGVFRHRMASCNGVA